MDGRLSSRKTGGVRRRESVVHLRLAIEFGVDIGPREELTMKAGTDIRGIADVVPPCGRSHRNGSSRPDRAFATNL